MQNIFLGQNGSNPFIASSGNGLSTPEVIAEQRATLEARLQQLAAAEQSLTSQPKAQPQTASLWSEIDDVTSDLSDPQFKTLSEDEEYAALDTQLGHMLQEAMIASAKPIVEASKNGNELLVKMRDLVKAKKASIIKQSNEELKVFNQFQEYARSNPNATYAEFLATQNK